jgi:hypothetical protein
MATTITLHPRSAARIADPFFSSPHGTQRYVLFVPIEEVPEGISTDPTPRGSGTRWDVVKTVRASLLDEDCTPGTFHLKNRGITMVAREVQKHDDREYEVILGKGHGIVDGRHTYQAILETLRDPSLTVPRKQYVRFEIITGVPENWVDEMARGLNASMQFQDQLLEKLQDAVAWIKDELAGQAFSKDIAWSETQRGAYDVGDLLCLLTCFNVDLYPNEGANHPVVAYENKAVVLKTFEQEYKENGGRAYKRLQPILRDILILHDTIRKQFAELARRDGHGKSGVLERSPDAPFQFPFTQSTAAERAARGALYPVLAAFRWMVQFDPESGELGWNGGFSNVLHRWGQVGPGLVTQSVEKLEELGSSADAVGRSKAHWAALHREVAFLDLMNRQSAPVAEPVQAVSETPAPTAEKISSIG